MKRLVLALVGMVLCSWQFVGCRAAVEEDTYRATIRRTSFGIPHIEAADIGSLAFGDGYAGAQDHLCSLADQVIRARGERARYYGRGPADRHLRSDIAVRTVEVHAKAKRELEQASIEDRDWLDGYAAGYNLADKKELAKAMKEFDAEVGLDKLVAVHANDSKIPLGGGVDRHENIGKGHIGRAGFETIMSHPAFSAVPLLLEVPGMEGEGPDKPNVDILKRIRKKVGAA